MSAVTLVFNQASVAVVLYKTAHPVLVVNVTAFEANDAPPPTIADQPVVCAYGSAPALSDDSSMRITHDVNEVTVGTLSTTAVVVPADAAPTF